VGQEGCSIYGEDTVTDEEGKFRLRGLLVRIRRLSLIYVYVSVIMEWYNVFYELATDFCRFLTLATSEVLESFFVRTSCEW